MGLACSYDPHAKKRGLPEGYVRGLEKLLALSLCNIDGLEDAILAMIGATAEFAERGSRTMKLWTDNSASESLHNSWKTSRLFGALEKMLSGTDASQSLGKRSWDDCENATPGVEQDWGFRVRRNSTRPGAHSPFVVESVASPSVKRARLFISSESQSSPHPANSSNDTLLQLPPQTSQLLDIYFTVTHSWFPIMAKHSILRASYQYVNAPFSVAKASPGSGDHAALWAILSYTTAQSTPQGGLSGMLSKAKEYYSVARKLIPLEKERHELGHVQALLLLTLVNIGLEDWTAAWLLCGQAMRTITGMELGTRSDERTRVKAVFLGCFVVDSLLSFRLSRNPGMRPRDLASVGLLEEDGLEEWNSWIDVLSPVDPEMSKNPPHRGPVFSLSCFNRLVELAGVLNRIAGDSSTGPNAYALAQRLLQELKQWEGHLPLGCRLTGPESIYPERHSPLLPHQTYLCLTYIATLLWLYVHLISQEQGVHRPILEVARKLLYRTLPILSQHFENFKTCSLPPIFEFSLRTIAQQAFALRNKADSDTFPFTQWTEALLQRTAGLGHTWPVYRSLNRTIDGWKRSKDLPEMSAFSFHGRLMDGSQFSDGPLDRFRVNPVAAATTQQRSSIYPQGRLGDLLTAVADSEDASPSVSIPVDRIYMTPKNTDLPLQQALESFNLPGSLTSRRGPDTVLHATVHPELLSPESSVSTAINPGTSIPSRNGTFSNAGGHNNNSNNTRSTSDIDTIFKDLAYLDTTEWANRREEGLRDFGFIDDITFQAFCHDPDRLAGSQPLVHPPSIADIWPPPGFFPETFQESMDDPGS